MKQVALLERADKVPPEKDQKRKFCLIRCYPLPSIPEVTACSIRSVYRCIKKVRKPPYEESMLKHYCNATART